MLTGAEQIDTTILEAQSFPQEVVLDNLHYSTLLSEAWQRPTVLDEQASIASHSEWFDIRKKQICEKHVLVVGWHLDKSQACVVLVMAVALAIGAGITEGSVTSSVQDGGAVSALILAALALFVAMLHWSSI